MTTSAPHTQVRHFGRGPRAAIAIHCTLAHAGAWSGVAAELSEQLSITAYDLPSHGGSDDWTPDRDQHRMATDMGLSLLTERMDLIGHSYGATVAMRMAIELPEQVRSLIMIEPVFFAAMLADAPEGSEAHRQEALKLNELIESGDTEAAARAFNRDWGDGRPWAEIPDRSRRYMADRMGFVLGSHSFLYHDTADILSQRRLEALEVPALLLEGAQSPLSVDLIHTALARRIPNATRATVEGAGHMLPITHPKDVAARISSFLDVT